MPAAVAVWSGWVGLGGLCGFGVVHPLPGIWDSARLNTAITLPIGIEAYGIYAMTAWLRPRSSDRVKRFSRRSSIGSLGLGMLGQVAYHLLSATHAVKAPWPITMLVACLPVISLGFGAALAHLLKSDQEEREDAVAEAVAERDRAQAAELAATAAEAVPAQSGPSAEPEGPATRTTDATRQVRRAVRILRRNPSITGQEMGDRFGVSERHGRRILAAARDSIDAEEASSNLTVNEPVVIVPEAATAAV